MSIPSEPPAAPVEAPAAPPAAGPSRLSLVQELGLVVVVVLLGLLLAAYGWHDSAPGRPNTFLNFDNLIDGVATPMSYYAIMAVGMTVVIITGGIDISVGATMALAALGYGRGAASDCPPMPRRMGGTAPGGSGGAGDRAALRIDQRRAGRQPEPASVHRDAGHVEHLPRAGQRAAFAENPARRRQTAARWRSPRTSCGRSSFGMQPVPLLIMLACVGLGWFYLRMLVGRPRDLRGRRQRGSRALQRPARERDQAAHLRARWGCAPGWRGS